MQQLTKEQMERCFRACGGTNPHTPGVIIEEYALPDGYHTFLLPLDPCFWFPRLWERLQAVANGRSLNFYSRGLPSCREYDILMGSQWLYDTTRDICEALCAAIEVLEKEKKT